jgi:DNA repair protein RecO (recombination protein O)
MDRRRHRARHAPARGGERHPRADGRARLDEHLGHFTVEAIEVRTASVLSASHAVFGVTHLAALCRLLAERDPHPSVYEALDDILSRLANARDVAPLVARFELAMLAELGFGLDLQECAASGATSDLVYVSPKSGRAVSRAAGAPWQDRLLRLPGFLHAGEPALPSTSELEDAFLVTGYFLQRHVFEPRGIALPDARAHLVAALVRALPEHA